MPGSGCTTLGVQCAILGALSILLLIVYLTRYSPMRTRVLSSCPSVVASSRPSAPVGSRPGWMPLTRSTSTHCRSESPDQPIGILVCLHAEPSHSMESQGDLPVEPGQASVLSCYDGSSVAHKGCIVGLSHTWPHLIPYMRYMHAILHYIERSVSS